jgi:hypothetical protein
VGHAAIGGPSLGTVIALEIGDKTKRHYDLFLQNRKFPPKSSKSDRFPDRMKIG